MDLGLKSKTAVVTGASIGIGRAIAKGLAAEGVRVIVDAGPGSGKTVVEILGEQVNYLGTYAIGAEKGQYNE